MLHDYKSVIIFSEPNNAGKIARYRKTRDDIVIAFSIDGKLALEKYGIDSYFPDEVIDLPDLNQIGIDNLKHVEDICNTIDGRLKEEISFLKENNINLFYNSFFTIKVFFDNLITSYLILDRLFAETGRKKVVIFKNRCGLDKIVEGKGALIPALIEDVFSKSNDNIGIILNNRRSLKDLLPYEYASLYKFFESFYVTCKQSRHLGKHQNCGLVLDCFYDVGNIVNDTMNDTVFFKVFASRYFIAVKPLNSTGMRIRKVAGNAGQTALIRSIFREIFDDLACHGLFQNNTELRLFAVKCLETYFIKSVSHLLPYGGYVKRKLSGLAPKVLCTSSCRLDLKSAFLLGIVKSLKIPVVTYQEGGGAGYLNWPLFNLDTALSDFYLVYGEGVAKSPFINKCNAEVVAVGSIYLENLKKNVRKDNGSRSDIYVVLDNIKTDTRQHYPYNNGFFSQAYRHQLGILNTLKRFRDMHFVLKTVKGKEYLYLSFVDSNLIRLETKPLSKFLNTADAFILDYPSTVLQECLLTDKPIALLYNKHFARFEENAFEFLKRRVRVATEPDKFYDVICALIEDIRNGNNMTKNCDFLESYCLMNNTSQNVKGFFEKMIMRQDIVQL